MYELAFQALQYTPVLAFERYQRRQIFQLIFQVIIRDRLPTSALVVDHINLLVRHIETTHQPLRLLGKLQRNADDDQLGELSIDEAPLISLMRKLNNHHDVTSDDHTMLVIKQLGSKTLQYI